jgi:hypothetical protein
LSACNCLPCRDLAQELEGDPELLDHYRRRLLVRGWPGTMSPVEKAYAQAHRQVDSKVPKVGLNGGQNGVEVSD